MKKTIILLCILMFTFSLMSGCNKNKADENSTTQRPTVRITFPEGYNTLQIAKLLEENGVCSAQEFMDAAKTLPENFSLTANLDNAEDRIFLLEGYLYPDTYDFFVGEGAQNALWRFLKNTQSKITQEDIDRAEELGYSMDEILTLASVIQSEAGDAANMKKVSSVFYNRLNSSYKRLESDVTHNYYKVKLSELIAKEDWEKYDQLYGTYIVRGLPIGPICNPGRSAINAALYPDETDYLFFVTDKEDGSFYYASTFEAHTKNVKEAGW